MAIMVWRARSATSVLRWRSTRSRQIARASAYCPAAARASASWNLSSGSSGCSARAARVASTLPPACRPWSRRTISALSRSASGSRYPFLRLHLEDASLGVLQAAVGQGDPRQADLRLRQVGVERQRRAVLGLGGPGIFGLQPARLGGEPLGRGRQQPLEPGADGRLRLDADEAIDHLTVPHREDGRDRPHAEIRRQAGLALGVDLGQHELTAVFVGQSLQHRAERPARAAPLGPEVDHDRNFRRALDHLALEVLRRRLDDARGGSRLTAHELDIPFVAIPRERPLADHRVVGCRQIPPADVLHDRRMVTRRELSRRETSSSGHAPGCQTGRPEPPVNGGSPPRRVGPTGGADDATLGSTRVFDSIARRRTDFPAGGLRLGKTRHESCGNRGRNRLIRRITSLGPR